MNKRVLLIKQIINCIYENNNKLIPETNRNNTLILEFNEVQCMDINTNTICQELNKLIFENKNQAPVMHMCNNLSNGTMNESNLINNQKSDKSLDSKLLIQSTSNPNLESSYLLTVHSETMY